MSRHRLLLALAACLLISAVVVAIAGGSGSTEPYATYQQAVTADTPTTQYRFDDVSGTNLTDSAGTRTATLTSVALGATGPFGGASAGTFNGSSSFAQMPASNPLAAATVFTVEAWVNWSGGASYNQHIFDLGSSTSKYMFLTPASSVTGNPMRFEIRSKSNLFFNVDAPKLTAGWHYLAVTEDAQGSLKLYVDGALANTTTGVTISPATLGATTNNWLGKSQTSTDPKFSGSLSNVAFYTSALSGARIQAHWYAANFPVNTAPPAISGTTRDGNTITTSNGTWSGLTPITFDYQWQRCDANGANCADVSGATATSYSLTSPDVGSKLQVKVKGTNTAGNSTATSATTAQIEGNDPTNTSAPTVSGNAVDGQTMTADKGTWTGTTPIDYAYQWQRCDAQGANCTDIAGAQTTAYGLTPADVGTTVRMKVTATNATHHPIDQPSAVSNVIAGVRPSNTALPSITGNTEDGKTLTADKGTWTGTTPISYSYQWRRCDTAGANCVDIAAATGSSYVAASTDIGSKLRVTVTATNVTNEPRPATSAATATIAAASPTNTSLPVISGQTSEGSTLTADRGTWTGTTPITYAYQWLRCDATGAINTCSNIAGATAQTYALTAADVGNELRVRVTASNVAGPVPATSAASSIVVPTASGVCTNVWNGRANTNAWDNPGNWSAGRVPDGTDRACAGSTTAIQISRNATAKSIYSTGSIDITYYTLSLGSDPAGSTFADLSLSLNATLSMPSAVTVTHSLVLKDANVSSWSTLTLAAGATGTVNPGNGSAATMDGGTFSIAPGATSTIATGALVGKNGAAIANAGQLNVNSESWNKTGLAYGDAGAYPQLRNTGTVAKTAGTGASVIAFGIDNQGTVDTRTGTLRFSGGGTRSPSLTSVWRASSGATTMLATDPGGPAFSLGSGVEIAGRFQVGWTNASTTASAADIHDAAADGLGGLPAQLIVNGGSFNANLTLTDAQTPSTVADLTVASGASLGGAASLTATSSFSWSGGTISGSGVTTVAPNAIVTVNPPDGSTATLDQRTLMLSTGVSATIVSGAVVGTNGATIQNNGLLRVNSQTWNKSALFNGNVGGAPQLRNTGTVAKTAGTGASAVGFAIDNQGTVDVQTGILQFTGGGTRSASPTSVWRAGTGSRSELFGSAPYSLGSGVEIAGELRVGNGWPGANVTAADVHDAAADGLGGLPAVLSIGDPTYGATFMLTNASTPSTVADLTLLERGTLAGAGSLTITRGLTWGSGSMSGSGVTTLAQNATGTVDGGYSGDSGLDGRTLRNLGSLAIVHGAIRGSNGAVLDNRSRLYVNAEDRYHALAYVTGATPQLLNSGMVLKNVGTGTSTIDFKATGTGTYYQQTGTLAFGGSWNVPAPTVIGTSGNPPTITVALADGSTRVVWDGGAQVPVAVHATGNLGVSSVKLVNAGGTTVALSAADCSGACPSPYDATLSVPASALTGNITTFNLVAANPVGGTATQAIEIVDSAPPQTTILAGPDPTTPSASSTFSFTSSVPSSSFECQLDSGAWDPCTSPKIYSDLADGGHAFAVRATSPAGYVDATPDSRAWTRDATAPDTAIDSTPSDVEPGGDTATFDFSSPDAGASFECKLDTQGWSPCAAHQTFTGLADGSHTLQVRGVDIAGNRDATPATRTWIQDVVKPVTIISAGPTQDALIDGSATFTFTTNEADATTECRLDSAAEADWSSCTSPTSFDDLPQGDHTFEVRATDQYGLKEDPPPSRSWTVERVGPRVTIDDAPAGTSNDGTPSLRGTASTDAPGGVASETVRVKFYSGDSVKGAPVKTVDVTRTGTTWSLDDAKWENDSLPDGVYSVRAEQDDISGNTGHSTTEHFGVDANAPQATAAVDELQADTSFLYQGESALQTGVSAEAITAEGVGVLRGRVTDEDGNGIAGATVQVVDHPEFGQTVTQANGEYYVAVDAGARLTVRVEKEGFTSVDRAVVSAERDYTWVDSVVLLALDSVATTVDLSAPMQEQVVRSSVATDADGERQATLLVAPGTDASMKLGDGTTAPLGGDVQVRATEYTVGNTGEAAMPGTLPPTSAYTYAVNFTVDQAEAADATSVSFDKPIYSYTDNFLDIAVGEDVPSGYYDQERAIWVPSESGRVIKVVSVANGLAQIDADGDGSVDDGAALDALGFTDQERTKLATLYAPGKTLWRVPLRHFTSYDFNYGQGIPNDAVGPNGGPTENGVDDGPCKQPGGSTIDCENQAIEEEIPVAGTGLSLHYQSDRSRGYKARDTIDIPVSGPEVPVSLHRIEVSLSIAGRHITSTLRARPNQRFTYVWDGKDVFGRTLDGRVKATIDVAFVYGFTYGLLAGRANCTDCGGSGGSGQKTFGAYLLRDATVNGRGDVRIRARYTQWAGSWNAEDAGLGGWTLSNHAHLDRDSGTLYEGDGTLRSADDLGRVIDTVATGFGIGSPYKINADGKALTVGPDGNVYVADSFNNRVVKVAPNGATSTVANVSYPTAVAVAPDGSLYVASWGLHKILKFAPGATQGETVLGNGTGNESTSPDGTDPLQAAIAWINDLEVGPDGALYFVEKGWAWYGEVTTSGVRRLTSDGRLESVTQIYYNQGWGALNGPAAKFHVQDAEDVAFDSRGNLYIASGLRAGGDRLGGDWAVLRVTPDGIIRNFAGHHGQASTGDGALATDASLMDPDHIAIGPDDRLYISESGTRIRVVGQDGIIRPIAGNGNGCCSGDGGLALSAGVPGGAIAVAPDGSLYVYKSDRLRRVHEVFGPQVSGATSIAAADGEAVYDFDANGRESAIKDSHTGAVLTSFGYDANGLLSDVTDGDGNQVTIERDASGKPTAIVSPFGQRTTLTVDSQGYLATVSTPIDATRDQHWEMIYEPGGLLSTFVDPNDQAGSMEYDESGQLVRDEDGAGAVKTLDRAVDQTGFQVDVTTQASTGAGAMDERKRTARMEALPTGDLLRTFTDPSGLQTTVKIGKDGTQTRTEPNGTVTTIATGPDPRFRMQAPILKSSTVQTPAGRSLSMTASRQVTQSNPDDPMSITGATDTISVNGKSATSVFDRATKRYTDTSPTGRWEKTDVDSQGRPMADQVPGVTPVSFAYGFRGLLTEVTQGNRVTTYGYDTEPSSSDYGRVRTVTDSLNRTTTLGYDRGGRVKSATMPGGRTITYGYDAIGNVTSITPPGRPAHEFAPTPVGLTDTYTAPDVGDPARATHFDYNPERQITKITQPSGRTIDFTYDSGGRPRYITAGADQFDYQFLTGTGDTHVRTTELQRAEAPSGEVAGFTYDGALPLSATYTGPVPGSVTYNYDSFLRPSQETIAGTAAVNYGYDDDGLLTSAGGLTLTYDQRDSQGNITARNGLLTSTSLGTLTTGIGYNAFAEPTSLSARYGSSDLYSSTLTRDDGGRITSKTETVAGTTHSYIYGYTAAGELEDVTRDGTVYAHYNYGANGTRSSCSGPGCSILAATYDDQDRLRAYGRFSYDYTADGDLSRKTDTESGAETVYGYDGLGNLTTVGPSTLGRPVAADYISYVIGPFGERVGKRVGGSLVQGFIYGSASGPAAETDGQGNITARYVYGSDDYTPDYMVKGSHTYRVITDERGSVRLVVDTATGNVAQQLDYDEFGRVLDDSNPGFQPFGFAGGIWDADTGLLHLGAREYDPETGRFTTKDPLGFGGGDPNLYGYVLGDPVNLVDPEGTKFSISAFAAGALNSMTMGASNAVAGKIFGFDPSCADWGDGYGLGSFFGDLNPKGLIRHGVRAFAEREGKRAFSTPAGRLTTSQAGDLANWLGYRPTNLTLKGQRVFYDRKKKLYIVQDIDSHSGGTWKMAKSYEGLATKSDRLGTYDHELNRIGD